MTVNKFQEPTMFKKKINGECVSKVFFQYSFNEKLIFTENSNIDDELFSRLALQ